MGCSPCPSQGTWDSFPAADEHSFCPHLAELPNTLEKSGPSSWSLTTQGGRSSLGPHKCPPSSPPWGPGPVHGLHTKLGPTRMRAGLGSRSEPTAGKATQQMSPKHLGDAGGMTSSLLLTQQLIKSIRSHYMPIWSSSNLTSSVRGVMVRGSLLPIWL